MSGKGTASRIVLAWFAAGALLLTSGCVGPLAPTPGYGDEVRANRDAMIANPDAGIQNAELAVGLKASTANGVLENYHRNEKAENQEQRQKSSKKNELQF